MLISENFKKKTLIDAAEDYLRKGKDVVCSEIGRKTALAALAAGTMIASAYTLGMLPTLIGFSAISFSTYKKTNHKHSAQPLKNRSFETWVHENFEVHTNVGRFSDAEIICFGEQHYDEKNAALNAIVINELSNSENDVILLEYDPKDCYGMNKYLFPLAGVPHVKKKTAIDGWDERSLEPDDIEFKRALQNVDKLKKEAQPFSESPKIDKEIEAAKCSIYKYWEDESKFFLKRNRHMCNKIESLRRGGRKIFVIGGRNHFDPKLKKRGFFHDERPKAILETFGYLQKTRYAVFNIPKPASP